MEAIKIIGKVLAIDEKSGTSNKGAWKSITVSVEEQAGEYPSGAAIDYFVNDKNKEVENVKVGDIVDASFNLKHAEWNGRHFTNARGWKISILSSETPTQAQAGGDGKATGEESDDLPF